MERTNGIQSGMKKAAMVMFLVAAMASTGCSQNALLNPTPDQFAGETDGASTAKALSESSTDTGGQTSHPGGQISHP
jgi:outer membrane lipoprotein-sorting protein